MKVTLQYDRLYVVSEEKELCFIDTFSNGINIISGRNTSGKSTLIQSILYAFGINDVKDNLQEILSFNPIFRVDFTLSSLSKKSKFTIVRFQGSVFIKNEAGKITSFHGVDADNRVEHIKLKEFIRDLFGFSLMLEQKGEIKTAPLESMFLPYYVSQSVGWVYVRESFSNLGFYKGFKEDFLDYYLGVNKDLDKLKLSELQAKKSALNAEINNLKTYSKSDDFTYTTLLDEELGKQAEEYLEGYIVNAGKLDDERNDYIKKCNELSLLRNHNIILRRTRRALENQRFNDIDRCPACSQILPHSLEGLYSHYQKINDTDKLSLALKEKLHDKQSEVNSLRKRAKKLEGVISDEYGLLLRKEFKGISLSQWINNKANAKLFLRIQNDIVAKEYELSQIVDVLRGFKPDKDVSKIRYGKEKLFKKIFKTYLSELGLKEITEDRFLNLYSINSFPQQGVELHKTVMSYHFALNKLISNTNDVHRFPFLLDAILKEDIDRTNLPLIFKFISKNLPHDTQSFISISEHIYDDEKKFNEQEDDNSTKSAASVNVKEIVKDYFKFKTKLIYIGDGKIERGFLSTALYRHLDLYEKTCEIIEAG